MKIIKYSLICAALISLVCMGCMAQEAPKKDGFPVVVAIEHSIAHANENGVDWIEYSVRSAELNVNGGASIFDRNSKDPYDISVVQKLRGKEYWEICYGTIVSGMVGATYCYYLDRTDYKLLAAYGMK
jgi:hypothetical protein